MKICGRLLIAAGLFTVCSGPSHAGGLRVTPLRLDFSPQQQSGQFELANLSDAPLAIQIKVFRWSQKDGQDDYQATQDLFFAPPIVRVAGKANALVRFRIRTPAPAGSEVPYRVYFQEVPPARNEQAGSGTVLRLRVGVPVFATSADPVYPSVTSKTSREAEGLRVHITNAGKAHIRISNVRLYPGNTNLKAPDQPAVAQAGQSVHSGNYLLAGSSDDWLLPLTAGADPKGLKLMIVTDDYSGHAAPGITAQGWWWAESSPDSTVPSRP